jgi:phage terminase large subunit-like protein
VAARRKFMKPSEIPAKWQDILLDVPGYDSIATGGDCFFDAQEAKMAIDFFPEMLVHVEGAIANHPFVLEHWQKAFVANLLGWKMHDEVGRVVRRYRETLLYVARKCGKSPIVAGLGLLIFFCDNERGQQCFLAAGDKEQAGHLFRHMRGMVDANPALSKRCLIYGGNATAGQSKSLVRAEDNSYLRVISADASGKHGGNTHLAIVDELHTQPNRDLVDVLQTSMASQNRKQPLMVCITTADYDRPSICNEKYEYAVKVRDGVVPNKRFLPVIYEVPRDADWKDEANWKLANPNLGVSVSLDYLRGECLRAQEIPAYEFTFRRLHLNQRCLAPWVLVSMADGTRKRAEDVVAGDEVISFNETTKRLTVSLVSAVFDNGSHAIYRITTKRGRVIETTANHPFWQRYGRSDGPKTGWKNACDLKQGDRIGVALGWPDSTSGDGSISAQDAYFLGLMTGDGSCGPKAGLSVSLSNVDEEIVNFCSGYATQHGLFFRRYLPHHLRIVGKLGSKGSNYPRRLLEKTGIWGCTSFTKRMPSAIFKSGFAAITSFLSGYLDTDGCVSGISVIWVSVSKGLLEDCQHALALLGVQSNLTVGKKKPFLKIKGVDTKASPSWRLEVHEANGIGILASVLDPLIARKKNKLLALGNLVRRTGPVARDRFDFDPIASIERLPKSNTIGIEVNGSHTHVTSGMITHNTSSAEKCIPLDQWDVCHDKAIDVAALEGKDCCVALDIGARSDFCALARLFPHDDGEVVTDEADPESQAVVRRSYTLLMDFWLPEKSAKRDPNIERDIETWKKQKLIRTTPGNEVDYTVMFRDIKQILAPYNVKNLLFDKGFEGLHLGQMLQQEYGDVVESFPQTLAYFNGPFREFLHLLSFKKIHHEGHPVMRWMASNVVADFRGGLMKPSKDKSAEKIDGMTAALMALAAGCRATGDNWFSMHGGLFG